MGLFIMDKEQTLKRKNARDIKYILKGNELNLDAPKREFSTNNDSKKAVNPQDFNQSITLTKRKKMDIRLLRYLW